MGGVKPRVRHRAVRGRTVRCCGNDPGCADAYIGHMQLPFAIRTLGQRLVGAIWLPIVGGVNRGLKWSIVSAGRGYGSGSFGRARIQALQAVVRPGDCVWDVGAHKGFMTLAAASMVGPTGMVVACEPSRRNRWFLLRHLRWNDVRNVTVASAALSDFDGTARFGGTGDSLAYTLRRGDEVTEVRTLPRGSWSAFGCLAPTF